MKSRGRPAIMLAPSLLHVLSVPARVIMHQRASERPSPSVSRGAIGDSDAHAVQLANLQFGTPSCLSARQSLSLSRSSRSGTLSLSVSIKPSVLSRIPRESKRAKRSAHAEESEREKGTGKSEGRKRVCSCFSDAYTEVKTEPWRAQGAKQRVFLYTFSHLNAAASESDAHSYREVFSMLASGQYPQLLACICSCVCVCINMCVAHHLRHCQRL